MTEAADRPELSSEDNSEESVTKGVDHDACRAADGEYTDEKIEGDESNVEGGVPPQYVDLLGEPSILWYESHDEYIELEAAAFVEIGPKGVVECILVRDFVNHEWEVRRLRRLKSAAIYRELAIVASDTLATPEGDWFKRAGDESLVANYARGSAMGINEAKKGLQQRARAKLLSPVDLHFAAYEQAQNVLAAINRELANAERRRDQVLKQLEDRRMTLAVMARSLIARGEAETIDVGVGAA